MSFKVILFSIFFLVIHGCGVKSDPTPPASTLLPSVESHYMEKVPTPTDEQEEKEKKPKTK